MVEGEGPATLIVNDEKVKLFETIRHLSRLEMLTLEKIKWI